MRCIRLGLLAALALACGGEPEPPAREAQRTARVAPETNRAPVIRSAQIVPAAPVVGEQISLNLTAVDPDGDRLDIQIEWFRNGRPFQSGDSRNLSSQGFTRGDQIYAVVRVSDGALDLTERVSTVEIANKPPLVTRIEIAPEQHHAGTELTAIAEAVDADGDPFEFGYAWYVNDKQIGVTEATLPVGKFKRGDRVRVDVVATDPYDAADPIASPVLTIPNGSPEIKSNPTEATVGAGRYRYVIKAEDPDGDRPLRYRLIEAPSGMTVDLLSGVVSWRVPSSAGGSYPIEVAVSDPRGAETHQRYNIDLQWQSEPAGTP